jgi:hypothetical protein
MPPHDWPKFHDPVPHAQVVLQDLTALLRGQGRVEPYQPHGVRLVEFGDGFP